MNWRRLLPLLNLLFILVELCDPTTPFIRISSEPVAKKFMTVVVQEANHGPDGKAAPVLESSERKPIDYLEGRSFAVAEYHDAVHSHFIVVPQYLVLSAYSPQNTGLKNQYDPEGLIRPPIAQVA